MMKSIIAKVVADVKKRFSRIDDMLAKSSIIKIADIIAELDKNGIPGWEEVPGYYTLQSSSIDVTKKPNPVDLNPNGIVLKVFANTNTGEIRFYIAKILDIPDKDREALW